MKYQVTITDGKKFQKHVVEALNHSEATITFGERFRQQWNELMQIWGLKKEKSRERL